MRTVILSGGVGGARFASGYARSCGPDETLTVIGNVADDEAFHGLWVSPDMDTLTYTLAGLEGPHGWGIDGDTTTALGMLGRLGQPVWMTLGDADLGLHIYRTEQRRLGRRPTDIAREIARALGVDVPILPATDDTVQTRIETAEGVLSFQSYFVKARCEPDIEAIRYEGITDARMTPEVETAIAAADCILIAPSNPIVSILPILLVAGVEEAIRRSSARRLAVSPFISGKAVKGPAVEMMRQRGLSPDAAGLWALYGSFLDGLLVDSRDCVEARKQLGSGIQVFSADILMRDRAGRKRVASEARAALGQLARPLP